MSESGESPQESGREIMLSWLSMARTARAAVAVCVIVAAAVIFLPQMRDILASLGDYSAIPGLEYHASFFFFALSAWYWSRTVLAARFHVPDDTDLGGGGGPRRSRSGLAVDPLAFKYVPRFLFLAVAFCAIYTAIRSNDYPNALFALAWAVAGVVLLDLRRRLIARLNDLLHPPSTLPPPGAATTA
ncbi:MAG TPA: hypothetical protein VMU22_00395 [Rhizomicrobium sp.]|nr:hypothetical protein [Rhizomicrobium sp.]